MLEGRGQHLDVVEAAQALAGEGGHAFAGLNCGHREAEGGQRARRLASTTAHLQHGRLLVDPGDSNEVGEQLLRVGRPHTVVELRYLVEQAAGRTSILARHPTILASTGPGWPSAERTAECPRNPPCTDPGAASPTAGW